ncbi:cyclic nucleotide-binding domain-containing protein [Actinomadura sp. NTSP31]|uniref:cyclic nucleotide-binding domain-containing protein n=1 Tax=Actinomadura sp. NTSP31 TaxID=1735447 RepID=UPI0035C0A10A
MAGWQPARRWEHPSKESFWMSLTAAEREEIEDAAKSRTYGRGALLCEEGAHSDHVIVIRSGWAKVARHEDGHEQIVTVRGPGDIVGERAALTRRSRSASVTALGAVRGLVLRASDFQEWLRARPRVRSILEGQERERLVEDDEQLFGDDPAGVEHRLAYLLSELAFRRGEQTSAATTLSLPMSCRDMARWVDAKRKDVAQVLEDWCRDGVVSTAPRQVTVEDAQTLDERCRGPAEPAWSSLHCSILYTDVAGFSASCRNESDRREVRTVLYDVLQRAFEDSGVSWSSCYHEDRGDGVLVIVPPEIPTRAVADPLIAWLGVGLHRHNRRASPATGVRLRVVLHAGRVTWDEEGLSGDAIIHAARMLDAAPLRDALERTGADLAFMASDPVYTTAVRSDVGLLDAASFRMVDFEVKSSRISAWIYVPDRVGPPSTEPPQTAASGQPSGTHFHGTVHVDGDLVAGNKLINGT